MSLKKKAQSTAEYAITLGLVVAITAGVLNLAVKKGIQHKNKEAIHFLLNAGDTQLTQHANKTLGIYGSEYRKTQVFSDGYVDEAVLEKGGKEERIQKQSTETTSVSIESLDKIASY